MRPFVKGSVGTLGVALVACATATGEVSGGEELFSLTPPPYTPPQTSSPDTSCEGTGGTGDTWSDLYATLFGPTGKGGSCTFAGSCHASGQLGAGAPGGIVCETKDGCHASFVDKGLVKASDSANPDGSALLAGILRIRKPDGTETGFMPKAPICAFSDSDLARIRRWIQRGAAND